MEIPPSDDQVSKKPNLQANLRTCYRFDDDGDVSVRYENLRADLRANLIYELVEQALVLYHIPHSVVEIFFGALYT